MFVTTNSHFWMFVANIVHYSMSILALYRQWSSMEHAELLFEGIFLSSCHRYSCHFHNYNALVWY